MGQDTTGSVATHEAAGRTRHWLYPIREGTGRRFTGRNEVCGPRFADFREGVLGRHISRGEGPLESGFLTIHRGDILWLYAGDELGIVGRGEVDKLMGRPEPHVTFTLDRTASRLLVNDPVPAALARRRLRGSLDRPVLLVDHPELADGFEWWVHKLDERDQRRLEPLGVPTLRQALTKNKALLDEPTLAALVRTLRGLDLALGVPTRRDGVADLVALNGKLLVVARVVEGAQAATPHRVLDEIGAAAWCGWTLAERAAGLDLEPNLWLACTRTPTAKLVTFIEDQGDSISWVQDGHLEYGPRTRLRWQAASSDAGVARGA